jgi:putative DNA-invertase from lambdoid prophage Rac
MMTEQTKAALYLRVSGGPGGGPGQSYENQRPEVVQLARARGLDIVAVYEETASAAKHRPQFEKMMLSAHRGEVSCVVVWALDRFGRNMVGNLTAVLELDRIGVQVVSVREPWLDTGGPVRSLLVAIFSWLAQQERERISERTKIGLDRARRAGKRIGRPRAHVDLAEARALLAGTTMAKAARKLGIGTSTLRRLLHADEALADGRSKTGVAGGDHGSEEFQEVTTTAAA